MCWESRPCWRSGSHGARSVCGGGCTSSLRKKEKLHLLQGLKRILLDIDKAIAIIRETEEEAEVIPNLMIGFGIDEKQAEYVAEIKLRNINKEYILKRYRRRRHCKGEIQDLEDTLQKPARIRRIMVEELTQYARSTPSPGNRDHLQPRGQQ